MIKKYLRDHRQLIFLAKHSIVKQYSNSAFGAIWAIINPLVMAMTFYVFYVVGMRFTGEINGHPLILFILAGNMAWTFMSSIVTTGTGYVSKNAEMLKNINLSIFQVVLIEIFANIFIHIIVMLFIFLIFAILDYYPHVSYLSFFYYWFLLVLMFSALSYITSMLSLLIKDIRPLIGSIMMPLFWMTPVLYVPTGNVETFSRLLNPFYFFISGYRDTLLEHKWFFYDFKYDLYIMGVILGLYVLVIIIHFNLRKKVLDLI